MKTIKPMTKEELQSLPDSAFPLELECFDGEYHHLWNKITVLSNKIDARGALQIKNRHGNYDTISLTNLQHFPSLNQEPEKVMWYWVHSWRKGNERHTYSSGYLYRSKEDFLKSFMAKESDFHFIDLVPVGEYPDYSEVE